MLVKDSPKSRSTGWANFARILNRGRRAIRLNTLVDALLVKAAERIRFVVTKRRDASKAGTLIQTDGAGLMDARFETQQRDTPISCVFSEVIEHHFGIP